MLNQCLFLGAGDPWCNLDFIHAVFHVHFKWYTGIFLLWLSIGQGVASMQVFEAVLWPPRIKNGLLS